MITNKVLSNISRIASIISKDNHIVLLSTLGMDGAPRSRYMGAFQIRDTADIYLICPSDTSKILEIQRDPRAQVIFSSKGYRKVLTLSGNAGIVRDESLRRVIYEEQEPLEIYPVFNDYFGVIHFVPVVAQYLDLDESNNVAKFLIPRD